LGDLKLAEANERLLVRLGFDLHDGPLQQVHVLAQDLRLLRDQVERLVEGENCQAVLGCFSDLESQLGDLHRDLRDLAHSLEPRALLDESLPDAVARELAAFERRADVATTLSLVGSIDALTDSQRIALLRVLQEALSNVRRHSRATSVAVTLADEGGGVRLEVRDDGRGFEPNASAAGEENGLGLVGMRERLRLLGGAFEIASRPGGPTTLTATLPHWHPVETEHSFRQ
jgi:two-component system NarL family sensor kinase